MCKKDTLPAVVVKEQLTSLLENDEEIKKLMIVSFKETVISTYNSHFPKSQELAKLEKIRPDITNDMMSMMQKHQEHEISYDNKVLEQEERRMDIIEKDISSVHSTIKRGQIIGALVVSGVLFMGWTLINTEHAGAAVSLILGAGGLGVFMGLSSNKTTSKNNSENEE